MAGEIRFSTQATIELDNAIAWYESRQPNLGIEFLEEIENAVSKIAEHPERFPSEQLPIRHNTLRRFPFTIFYEAEQGMIQIAAIWHQKRNR